MLGRCETKFCKHSYENDSSTTHRVHKCSLIGARFPKIAQYVITQACVEVFSNRH